MKTPESRRNIYAYSLLGCVTAIAFVGLLNIWDTGISNTFTYKSILSFVVIAGLSGFLYTLTFNHDVKLIEKLGKTTGVIATTLSVVILAQIWFEAFQEIFFGKLAVSLVIIGVIVAFVIAVFDDFFENKKLKDDNYLD